MLMIHGYLPFKSQSLMLFLFRSLFEILANDHLPTPHRRNYQQHEWWLWFTAGDRDLYHNATGWEHPGRERLPVQGRQGTLCVKAPPETALLGAFCRWVNLWLTAALEVAKRLKQRLCIFLCSLWVGEGCIFLTVWRTYELISLYPAACFISLQIFFWSH